MAGVDHFTPARNSQENHICFWVLVDSRQVKGVKMDTLGEEDLTNNISSGNRSNLSRIILGEVMSVIGFFTITEDELDQAGVNKGYSTLHPHNTPEMQSDTPNTRDNQQIM